MFLELQFSILTYCCLWLPRDWESPWLTIPYKVMAILVTFLIYTLTLSEFLDVVLAVENYEDLAGTLFMLLSFLAVCTKVANALHSRRDILDLTEFFLTEPCKPFSEREIVIQRGYDKMIR
uniref:Odorant receptor 4 n=1 Tax=Sclerodermus sp. MQW-2015 TaxID=1729718 RepID=A0A0N9JS14_9HYME|nr:odorant receptor 4 [Sclerodermus sp. MQW-2015]